MDYREKLNKVLTHWKMAVAFLIALFLINIFVINYFQSDSEIKLLDIPIFKTSRVEGNCFYQFQKSMKWFFLSSEEFIYPGTHVQSDEDSHIVLNFINQAGKIEISEKSFVSFYQSNQELIIEFQKGELFINYQSNSSQKPIFLKIGSRTFKFTNTDLYIRGDSSESSQVTISYGKVAMDQDGLVNHFEKNQTLSLRPGKSFSVLESKFKIATPILYDRYGLAENGQTNVRFAFARFEKPFYYQLFIGNSPDNLKSFFQSPQEFKQNEFVIKLPQGSYYWRLGAFDKKRGAPLFFSDLSRFFIDSKISAQPVFPAGNSLIDNKEEGALIRFQWDNPSQLEKIHFELSKQKDFSELLIHQKISMKNYYNLVLKEPGIYFWRVTGFPYGQSEMVISPSRKFELLSLEKKVPIKILFPQLNSVLTTVALGSMDIEFEWTSSDEIEKFKVVFINNKSNEIQEIVSSNTSYRMNNLEPGSYTWYIQDYNNSKLKSESSRFTVLPTEKIFFTSKNKSDDGVITWDKGKTQIVEYRVDVAKIGSRTNFNSFFDVSSNSKKSFFTKKQLFDFKKMDDGVYAVKVYGFDKGKNIIADSSMRFIKIDSD